MDDPPEPRSPGDAGAANRPPGDAESPSATVAPPVAGTYGVDAASMLLTARVRRTSWNPMKPRIQCVLAHWIPGSIASGGRQAGAGGADGTGVAFRCCLPRPRNGPAGDMRLTGIALELQSSRGRIRTFVDGFKVRSPARLEDPGWFESSLYWNQGLNDLRQTAR